MFNVIRKCKILQLALIGGIKVKMPVYVVLLTGEQMGNFYGKE